MNKTSNLEWETRNALCQEKTPTACEWIQKKGEREGVSCSLPPSHLFLVSVHLWIPQPVLVLPAGSPSTSPLPLLHLLHISGHLVLSHQVSTIHLWQQLYAQWYLCYLIILETDLAKEDGRSVMWRLVVLAESYAFSSLFLWHLILFFCKCHGVLLTGPIF